MPDVALQSMLSELSQMQNMAVFEPVHHKGGKVIKSFMFLKQKFKPNGEHDKLKSRLVGGGNMQDRTLLYDDEVSSPTVAATFIFLIASIAAQESRTVITIDIGGAYLNADISQYNILMSLDPTMSALMVKLDPSYANFRRHNDTIVVRLKKALYGCIQSGKLWYDLLTKVLIKDGFIINSTENCVFNKLSNNVQVTVCIYVDDIMITSKNPELAYGVEDLLRRIFKTITVKRGIIHNYLGMEWSFQDAGQVKVTMQGFIREVTQAMGITSTALTPASNTLFDRREVELLPVREKELFHSTVAKILYLSKRVRPDILLSVSYLTTRVQSPDVDDQRKLLRVLQYLHGTSEIGVVLRPGLNPVLVLSIDASYGVHSDGKSHSGMTISYGKGSILAQSTKQKLVVKSSTEAELVALSDKAGLGLWCQNFLNDQGLNISSVVIKQDNQSTIALIEKGRSTSEKTRHVNIRYFWIKDRIDNGNLKVEYQATEDMVADVLTKPLQGDKFVILRNKLLNWPM
jgi:histone deacetylase 1/2